MDRPERKVLWLPAGEIRPNPMQPRRTFEEAPLRELAESIRRHGILQPLTVRRIFSLCARPWATIGFLMKRTPRTPTM